MAIATHDKAPSVAAPGKDSHVEAPSTALRLPTAYLTADPEGNPRALVVLDLLRDVRTRDQQLRLRDAALRQDRRLRAGLAAENARLHAQVATLHARVAELERHQDGTTSAEAYGYMIALAEARGLEAEARRVATEATNLLCTLRRTVADALQGCNPEAAVAFLHEWLQQAGGPLAPVEPVP